ncbi:MAG: serine hydrolase [Legionellaceae bacterium]|nr:serine hydrolase [Legionellaceae bacterium]
MSPSKKLAEALKKATGKGALPVKFWEDDSKSDAYTVEDVLNQYVKYCHDYLNPAQKKAMSMVFWSQIEAMGSPIMENIPDKTGQCAVYFLFPATQVDAGNDLYLQGDFHGYGTTERRARLSLLEGTDIMFKHDVMQKDDLVTYQFVQLPKSIQDKNPTELAGSSFVEPPQVDYFAEEKQVDTIDSPPMPENPPDWFQNPEVILKAAYSKDRPVFYIYGEDKIFLVNADEALARLSGEPLDFQMLLSKTPAENKPFVLHDVFYANRSGDIHPSEHIPVEQFFNHPDEAPYDDLTRLIYVLKPKVGAVEHLVFINDGLGYLHSGAMQQLEDMIENGHLSPHTGVVWVHTLPALAKMIDPPEGNEKASLAGMGERTIDYEYGRAQYVEFIEDKLFPQLEASGFEVPKDKNHRVMVGSSLSGTFALWVASEHPELFGTVIAQSPSPSNRSILRETVATYDASKPRSHIILSCGKFESPNFAANGNLQYTQQVSTRLNIPMKKVGPHGHQFLPWTQALADDLPKAQLKALIEHEAVEGTSVAVFNAEDIRSFAAGKRARDSQQDLTSDSIFEAASLSKPVFAYIVLKMAERGEINLDTPLCDLSKSGFGPPQLRDTPEYQQLTARMILSHQTGLPNWIPETFEAEPQTQFNYSGLAYCCLCDVIQDVSGQSLEQLAKQALEPLGIIQSTYFYQPEDTSDEKKRFAIGHHSEGEPDERSHYPRMSEVNAEGHAYPANPAASLFITAEHYAQFLDACLKDAFIREHMFVSVNDLGHSRDQKALQEGVSPDVLERIHWGLGMGVQDNEDGSKTLFHWGDSETFRHLAAIRVDDSNDYSGVVCLTNSANGPAIFRQVIEPMIGSIEPVAAWLRLREQLPVSTASFTSGDEVGGNISRTQSMRDAMKGIRADDTKQSSISPKG